VTADQTQRFGLPCGGRLDLLIEQLTSAASVRTLLDLIDARRNCARRLCLATGEVSLHPGTQDEAFRFDGADAIKVFGPQWRLLLTGAGQLSRYVAEMALALDYHVVVCDPREEYARTWAVAETELDAGAPDAAVRAYAYDARSALLALAHDPQLDDPALCAALGAETFYVGALGSRANQAKRTHRLTAFGVTPLQLARLHGPVGLPIGARTPAEIAVAILAELTAARHGVRLQAPAEAVPGTLAACRG
jgi:xanthine dehydrogenase accessory factor